MNFRQLVQNDERELEQEQEQRVSLSLWRDVEELWTIEQSGAFVNGFIAAALLWTKTQPDDYYFVLETKGVNLPISNDYNHYLTTANTIFYASFTPNELLTTLLEQVTEVGHYGILISMKDTTERDDIIAVQCEDVRFIQGLLSAIDTFNLPYVLRYNIHRDGVYYNIAGRNLIMPTV